MGKRSGDLHSVGVCITGSVGQVDQYLRISSVRLWDSHSPQRGQFGPHHEVTTPPWAALVPVMGSGSCLGTNLIMGCLQSPALLDYEMTDNLGQ